ncbi:peptidylprolyl isomerase [Elongatibacter sediminis]|uniref:Peptidyl-prolyl cis-trans isomerase n=1 Tax=Elongatibacter sediminis TaxID=3119006 RepID=A0AAW9RE56_9GAMM
MFSFLRLAAFATALSLLNPSVARAEFACFPEEVLPDNLFPTVRVETSMGAFDIELNRLRAPVTSNNFLRYVLDGHYDGTIFHRVMPGFVVQGGGYTRDWEERPVREPIINESGNGLGNVVMSVAMARFDDPHSATAQWFVNLSSNESLDPNSRSWGYAVFGSVIAGREVVEAIAGVDTGYSEAIDAPDVPLVPVLIERVYVVGME